VRDPSSSLFRMKRDDKERAGFPVSGERLRMGNHRGIAPKGMARVGRSFQGERCDSGAYKRNWNGICCGTTLG
jgi:hypothetical protein